jgi:hypothetical protein
MEIMDENLATNVVEKVDSIIGDAFISGFFWGFAEGSKDKMTISDMVKGFNNSYLTSEQKEGILSIIDPLYEKYDVEKSLLNSYS